jgi:hypothetical protein
MEGIFEYFKMSGKGAMDTPMLPSRLNISKWDTDRFINGPGMKFVRLSV